MPGESSASRLGRPVGVLVAAPVVGLFALDPFTDLQVPTATRGGSLPGLAVAVVAVVAVV